MGKLSQYLYAKYRAFAPLSCFASPRPDVASGWTHWRWLIHQRQTGRFIDPTVQIRCRHPVQKRLLLADGTSIDRGVIIWISDEMGDESEKTTNKTNKTLNQTIASPAHIYLGQKTYVGPYAYLGSCHQLTIGDHSLIGAHSYLITVNHRTDQREQPVAEQGFRGGSITIGRNVWIGCHVVILPNITIGDNAIIAAGAVVTKHVPAGETWGGVPARRLSDRHPHLGDDA